MKRNVSNAYIPRAFSARTHHSIPCIALGAIGLLALLFVAGETAIASGAPSFVWTNTFDAPRRLELGGIAADNAGNVYVAGHFEGRSVVGSTRLASEGGTDIFIAKVKSDGEFVWVAQYGTTDSEIAHKIGVDAFGNSYVYGRVTRTTHAAKGFFLAKYSPEGKQLWLQPAVESDDRRSTREFAYEIDPFRGPFFAVDAVGDSFLIGRGNVLQVIGFGPHGLQRWSTPLGDRSGVINSVDGIAGRKSGGVVVVGSFEDTVKIGGKTLIPGKAADFFVVCLNANGTVAWVEQSESRGNAIAIGLALGSDDSVLVVASLQGETTFGDKVVKPGLALVKYDPNGKVLRAVGLTGDILQRNAPGDMQVDASENIVALMSQCTSCMAGSIVSFDLDGHLLWELPQTYKPHSMTIDSHGGVFISTTRHAEQSLIPQLMKLEADGRGSSVTDKLPTPAGSGSGLVVPLVCPNGSLGQFRHGTKCVGYYDATQPDGRLTLIDIQLAGKASSKSYTKTKSLVHAGVDIVAPEGSEIRPVADGTVDDVIVSPNDENFGSLGYMVIVEHAQKFGGKSVYSVYLHMREKPNVTVGQSVKAGETVLGLVGSTGAAFGPHIHFELRRFAGRFSPKWKNIYGIERPKDEATFDESDFAANWLNPENPAAGTSGPSGQTSQDTGTAESSKASPISGPATDPSDPVALEKQLKELMGRTPRAPDQPDKILSDAKAGVTVSYPAAFAVSREKRPVVAFFLAPNGGETEQSHAKISVTCSGTPLLNPNPPLESVVNSTMVGTKSALVDATISRPLKTTLAGGEAQVFIVTGKEDGVVRQKAVTVAVYRKHILGVVLHATPETFLKYWDDYRRVCDSYALR